jgi:hypothetical protein
MRRCGNVAMRQWQKCGNAAMECGNAAMSEWRNATGAMSQDSLRGRSASSGPSQCEIEGAKQCGEGHQQRGRRADGRSAQTTFAVVNHRDE